MSEWQETEISKIPTDWKIKKVFELVDNGILARPMDGNHGGIHPKHSDFVESGIPFIMASDLENGKVNLIDCKFISKSQADTLRKGFSVNGDVLLTHKATLGRTAVVKVINTPYIMLTPQVTYYRVIDSQKLNHIFLRYFFTSRVFQETLLNYGSSGSTRNYLGVTAQLDLPILLPPLEEQEAIAAVLSSLDDKIDLLQRQNKTLEALAQTLFRHWFIDAAANFYETELENVLTITSSKRIFYKEYVSQGVPFYRGKEVIELSLGHAVSNNLFISKERYQEIKSKFGVPEKGDILLTSVGTLGVSYQVDNLEEFYFKDGNLTWFRNFDGKVTSSFIYFWLRSQQAQDLFNEISIGSTQRALTIRGLKSLIVPIIKNENERANSYELLSRLSEKIRSNVTQVRTLEQLRDTLLPKLMSGQVRVRL